jgi:hypothetical protein
MALTRTKTAFAAALMILLSGVLGGCGGGGGGGGGSEGSRAPASLAGTWTTTESVDATGCDEGNLNYSGGWNSFMLSITGNGFGNAIDLLDVEYLKLTIEP